jgi:hypothetical protein
VVCFDYVKDGIRFLLSQMYAYVREIIGRSMSVNNILKALVVCGFHFEVPLFTPHITDVWNTLVTHPLAVV